MVVRKTKPNKNARFKSYNNKNNSHVFKHFCKFIQNLDSSKNSFVR